MKNSTRFTLVAIFLLITSGMHAQRILRWQVNNMASNTYDIKNTNNSNTFLQSSNWRIVDAKTGSVTSTSAAPINGDTLQIFNASMTLSTNFDMTALQNIVLDFGDPRAGLSWSLLVKRDFTWLLHSTAKVNVRWGDLETEIDNVAPINTGIKIGGVFKLMAVDYATVTVHGPSHADMTTPVTTSILQEGFSAGTLPVVLVDFDAIKQNSGVQITWRTQQEYNTKMFNIEKSSDGKNFISIASVPAAGNSTVPRSYSYTDQATTTGISYYRVRIVSNDMISGFTSVKAVRASMLTRLGLFPNPAQTTTNLVINNPESIAFTVNVFNSFGQMVQQRKVAGGTNMLSLDVHALQAGDYTVDIQMADGSRQNAKLIIKK